MSNPIKRFLGIEEYQKPSEIIGHLQDEDSDQNFTNLVYKLLYSNNEFKLWLIASSSDIFIIRDNGFKLQTLLKRKRNNFEFEIISENRKPRLYFNNTITTLPINISFIGSIDDFKITLQQLIQ